MIRIYNAKILTMENGMQPFDGEIQTDGSRISYIGEKRSEERRVGKECLRLCRSRWSPYH